MIRQPKHQGTPASSHSKHLIHSPRHVRQMLDDLETHDGVEGVILEGQNQGITQHGHDPLKLGLGDM